MYISEIITFLVGLQLFFATSAFKVTDSVITTTGGVEYNLERESQNRWTWTNTTGSTTTIEGLHFNGYFVPR